MKLSIGTIYRYAKNAQEKEPLVDGIPNYFFYTHHTKSAAKVRFQSGIHGIQKMKDSNGSLRRPAIIVSSSPHKAGTLQTPWEDSFDPDNGYIRYYGDNKAASVSPENSPGNKLLLEAFRIHTSPILEERESKGVPIIFFKRVTVDGRQKGNLSFQGFGIIQSAELITQYTSNGDYFSNYIFGMCVFTLKHEGEKFSWEWINDRRDKSIISKEVNKNAPKAWREWIKNGSTNIERIRRKVSLLSITKKSLQIPSKNSNEYNTLMQIYNYYKDKKHHFELLAMRVVENIFIETGVQITLGWVTPKSADGGTDFVARIDISTGLSGVRLVILGQAKCESPNNPTNGRDIARTVARLKRGWFGAYITTSYFSDAVQAEIIEDQYPIMLINGLILAENVLKIIYKKGVYLERYLKELDDEYIKNINSSRPEEILKL